MLSPPRSTSGSTGGQARRDRARRKRRADRIRTTLLEWYRAHRRDLPWRRTSDPYSIWVSEAMLQQTRVETVIPYYERFLERFPDVEALASADEDDVISEWAGLGYYSRARNLQKAARKIAGELGGEFPRDAQGLLELPGVGRYTAGAVASIAFDAPEPIVDGNVVRVLTRVEGIRDDTAQKPVMDRLWEEAGLLAKGPSPGDLNQAIMELGATVCTPRTPRCLICPLLRSCDARRSGDADSLPIKTKRTKQKRFEAACAWVERGGKVLTVKRPATGLMASTWELPGGDLLSGEAPEEGLRRTLRERIGLEVKTVETRGAVDHVFSHRLLTLHVFRARTPTGRIRLVATDQHDALQAHRWIAPDGLESLGCGAATRRALELFEAGGDFA